MEKVLLILDKPKSCEECILTSAQCKLLKNNKKGCPFKPMPKKKQELKLYSNGFLENTTELINKGYNNCIDDINK